MFLSCLEKTNTLFLLLHLITFGCICMLFSAFKLTNVCINKCIFCSCGYAKTQYHLIYKSWFECFSLYIKVIGDTGSKVLDTLIAAPKM